MKKRTSRLAVLTATLVLAATGCATEDSATVDGVKSNPSEGVTDDTIKFGWMGAITGLSASTLEPKHAGTEAFFEYANQNGGVAGRDLELISYDDAGVVDKGLTNYSRLVKDDRVLAIVGQSGSQITEPLIPKVEQDKIPVIGPGATTASQLVTPYYWNNIPTYQDQADVSIAYAGEQLGGVDKIKGVTVSLAVPSGVEWREFVDQKLTVAGGTFVKGYDMSTTATDAVPTALDLQKLVKDDKVNYIFIHGNSQSALTLFSSMSQYNVDLPVVGIYGVGSAATFTDGPPEITDDLAFVHGFTPPSVDEPGMKTVKDFVAGTKWEKYIKEDSVHFINGWVDGMTTLEATKRAVESGDLSREGLQKALATITDLDTGGLSGTIDYSRYGHNGGAVARPYTFADGKFVAEGSYEDWEGALKYEY